MANHQLHLEPEFFSNGNQQELPYITLAQDQGQPQIKNFDSNATHLHSSPPHQEQSNSSNRFYQEYRRIYSVSYNIQTEKERLTQLLSDLNQRIKTLQNRLANNQARPKEPKHAQTKVQLQSEESKNKRARRTAEQIEKKFKCDVPFCQRYYGSEGSLQQHIKLKHPERLHHESSEEYRPNPRDKFDLSEH